MINLKHIFYCFCIVTFIGCKGCKDPVPPTPPNPPVVNNTFAKGADISWVTEMEAAGKKFYNAANTQTDCFALMKSLGMNTIRLRVWVNPSNNFNNANDVVAKAVRAKNAGLDVMINFHFSDTWADPGSQTKPASWANQDINLLKTSLASHTTDVLTKLKNAGVTPTYIQIGNETNNGMLWPEGKATTSMANFAQLINAGYNASKSIFSSAKVIVHLSNGYDNGLYRWMFDGLKNNNAQWDVIGMSLYPNISSYTWQNANLLCLSNMNDMVARYNKEVMIVEVGMPWDMASDCKLFLSDLITKVKSVSNNKGLGVLYWEPQCYGGWAAYTLGAFDNTGKPTTALDAFSN